MTSIDNAEESVDEAIELQEYLAKFRAKLIKFNGVVFASLSGKLQTNDGIIPYSLVPSNGTLAKLGKWNKLSESARLALIKQRIHGDSLHLAEAELYDFVAQAIQLAKANQVSPDRFWGGLIAPTELATRRFEIIESRIEAAGLKHRENNSAALTKASVSLALYPESFATAARMKRKFIAVLGPTNSGKTYQAMEALTSASTGVYLAPLRLLALENYERMEESDIAVSLITGEERRVRAGATHIASTIEMLDLHREVDVAVIDEIQMLEDRERGSAWTAAVCGVPARTVYLVGSLSARAAIEALVKRLGCELEIKTLTRKSPLVVEPKAVNHISDLKKGDCLIAFSRREVLSWRDRLQDAGFSVAVIYGALAPETRIAQSKRFREGEVDILVATDAVGMGLNLPVSRIVFTTATKFDGVDEDTIPVPLAQQIAGRAGRYGLHEEGFVAGFGNGVHATVRGLMRMKLDSQPVRGFRVAPTLDQLVQIATATHETSLAKLLLLFTKNIDVHDEFFLPADMAEQKERAIWLDTLPLTLEDKFLMSTVPVSTKVPSLKSAWENWARAISVNSKSRLMLERFDMSRNPLLEAEDICKKYSAYAWLSYRLPNLFPEGQAALEWARHLSMQIDTMLQAKNGKTKAPVKPARTKALGSQNKNRSSSRNSRGSRSAVSARG